MSEIILNPISKQELEDLLSKVVSKELVKVIPQSQPQEPDRYLTRREAADLLGVSIISLDRYRHNGFLPSYRIGRRILFRESEINNAIEKMTL